MHQEERRSVNMEAMREMLIRIDENTKNQATQFNDHKMTDLAEFAVLKQAAADLRERFDKSKEEIRKDLVVQEEVIRATLKTQTEKQDEQIGFQNKLMGAIALIAFVVPFLVAWYLKKGA